MTIHIPVWLLWALGIPIGLVVLFVIFAVIFSFLQERAFAHWWLNR